MSVKIIELVDRLMKYNFAYREGVSIVSDVEYDEEIELLRSLDPSNPFLNKIEPEKFQGKLKVTHDFYMLSIEKAYNLQALKRFVGRIEKEAKRLGISDITFGVTAKLDGLAARDNGKILVSRGDGKVGFDISNAFQKGVVPIGGRGQGLGEIVVVKSYFEENMADFFEHPRNMVVGIVLANKVNVNAQKALNDGKVNFVPYSGMETAFMSGEKLIARSKELHELIFNTTDYPVDGIVVAVKDDTLRNAMGFTAHHYRWQVAVKIKGDRADTVVTKINWQVGRSGNITPVMEVKPVFLSGATIRHVTAHNAGKVRSLEIGEGSKIKIIRSGDVIPKLESVIETVTPLCIPTLCPACGEKLRWNNNFLKCFNYDCIARVERRLSYWFKTLGNTESFGIKTIRKIVNEGYSSLESIYNLSYKDFKFLGFGWTQSRNLFNSIQQSIIKPIDDWRFLAAFAIPSLGLADSLKLLRKVSIYDIPNIKRELIGSIDGFGYKKSSLIENSIKKAKPIIEKMLAMKFNLILTLNETIPFVIDNCLVGKKVVFTGKMKTGTRSKMKTEAIQRGLKVQNRINQNTDYLICGDNLGRSKLDSANREGIVLLTEEQYLSLLND